MQRAVKSWVVVLLSGLLASCAAVWPPLVGVPDAGRSPACGPFRFSVSLLDGPMLSREAFLDTDAGQVVEEYFTVGNGLGWNEGWLASEGFSLVSEELVIGYRNGLPAWDWHIAGDRVAGGGCLLTWTLGDLTAENWSLAAATDEDDRLLAIEVGGVSCNGEVRTELAGVELVETAESIEVTAWVRGLGEERGCIASYVGHPAVIVMRAPIGGRSILNAGFIPGREVTFGER
ncbi:MAG: hypothetical protein WEE36_11340 [Acidimicrobiia bacterium]